jgi:hypothetical protein
MPDPTPLDRTLCCGPICGRGTDDAGPCVASIYGRAIRQRIEGAGYVVLSAADHDRRITELLEANNREVERRRNAEAAVATLRAENARLRETLDRIARKPWKPTDPTAPADAQIWDMVRQIIQFAHNALASQEPNACPNPR